MHLARNLLAESVTSHDVTMRSNYHTRVTSPLDDPGKKQFRCTPRGTKVVIYHLVGNFMLNSTQNVVSLATCAESL